MTLALLQAVLLYSLRSCPRNASSPNPALTAGWFRPPHWPSILCIGMAYGFSVFWLPLSKALGVTAPVACAPDMGFIAQMFSSQCDWPISMLGWIYTLFFIFLGCSAAMWGGWLEHAGPRKAGVVSALCWCGGLLISALGIYTHQIWLMWLGSGVIGGIGLGLGYISPVSTLIKWFPDKRGMATGMAIMGFGGGAMVGAPLAAALMGHFASPTGVGVWQSFVVMAAIYFVFMIGGALSYRVPPTGWKPEGWTAPAKKASNAMITQRHVHVSVAWKTPQFAPGVAGAVPERFGRYRHSGHGLAAVAGSVCRQVAGQWMCHSANWMPRNWRRSQPLLPVSPGC
jgi:MFS family permease